MAQQHVTRTDLEQFSKDLTRIASSCAYTVEQMKQRNIPSLDGMNIQHLGELIEQLRMLNYMMEIECSKDRD